MGRHRAPEPTPTELQQRVDIIANKVIKSTMLKDFIAGETARMTEGMADDPRREELRWVLEYGLQRVALEAAFAGAAEALLFDMPRRVIAGYDQPVPAPWAVPE